MLLQRLLRAMVRDGALTIEDARGRRSVVGDGSTPVCTFKMHRRSLEWSLLFNPSLRMGEAYVDGRLTFEDGGLEDFVELLARNYGHLEKHWFMRLSYGLVRRARWLWQHNPIGKAQKNVAHHYDLSARLYDLFLDSDRQYSCAYFTEPHDDLERAQQDKKRHIASKLRLNRRGLSLLDIGSGWGGLGLYLAEVSGAAVTGVTLSEEQHKLSRQRVQQAGLVDHIDFRLQDYRVLERRYDRIVSVGMFEHVGKANYAEYFAKLRDLLADDGVALVHSIARFDEPGPINPFIRKYIFPGADVPTLSEVLPVVEESGLLVTDIEVLRLHYAETLRLWRRRFNANRAEVAELYDERFCRMWDLYLVGCEMGFRYQGLMVMQLQLTRRQEALPLTRDYMVDWERAQAVREAAERQAVGHRGDGQQAAE